jgi:hypothetical protein
MRHVMPDGGYPIAGILAQMGPELINPLKHGRLIFPPHAPGPRNGHAGDPMRRREIMTKVILLSFCSDRRVVYYVAEMQHMVCPYG